MTTAAVAGVQTALQYYAAGWQSLAEVNSISGPTESRDQIDVTSLDTPAGYRDYITGFADGGQVVFNVSFTLVGYNRLLTWFGVDTTKLYRIYFPQASGTPGIEFYGYIVDLPLAVQPDDRITMDVTIKISGDVTLN